MAPKSQLVPGVPVPVAVAVRRLVAGNPGMMTGPGTNTYLLGVKQIAVIDPGPADPAHLKCILECAGAPIRWIIVTHTHRDHSPLAKQLAQLTGASIIGVPAPDDGRQDTTFSPAHVPVDGELLELGDQQLVAIHTPGHSSNCVCYLHQGCRMLFTGDHVLEGISPVIPPPDGDMTQYLASIERIDRLDFDRIAPGHGDVIEQAKRWLAVLRKHRLAREYKVITALTEQRRGTLDSLTLRVYDDVPVERHAWAQLTLEAHLIKLLREHRVSERDGVWEIIQA